MTVLLRIPETARLNMARGDVYKRQVRDMARQAEEVIVLTESEKFSKRGIVPLNLKDQVKAVITDSEIDSFYEAELISKRIQVIKA